MTDKTPTPTGLLADAAKTHSRRCGHTVYAVMDKKGEVLTCTTFNEEAASRKALDLLNLGKAPWGVAVFTDGKPDGEWDIATCRLAAPDQAA